MRKDSTIILLVSVLVTAAVMGGAYYMSVVRPGGSSLGYTDFAEAGADARTTGTDFIRRLNSAVGSSDVPAKTATYQESSSHTDDYFACPHPEFGVFWTNARTCEEADLKNRLSYAAPFAPTSYRDRYSESGYKSPRQLAANKREDEKPNLRLIGKPPPPGLPPECKFPVGKALEIERDLAAADDPYKSTWRKSYCRFRCEAIQDKCPVSDDYFYFRFPSMCYGTEHFPCYVPQG